jgi:hypothetical protein
MNVFTTLFALLIYGPKARGHMHWAKLDITKHVCISHLLGLATRFLSLPFSLPCPILSWQVKRRNSEESSTQWTTGIAEVQLPIEYAQFPFLLHRICIIIIFYHLSAHFCIFPMLLLISIFLNKTGLLALRCITAIMRQS